MKNMILATAAVIGLGMTSAMAASAGTSGYEFPDFWGDVAAQHAPVAAVPNQAATGTVGTYVTQSSHGTWLFPPNQNASG
jgi:hypothetical protein